MLPEPDGGVAHGLGGVAMAAPLTRTITGRVTIAIVVAFARTLTVRVSIRSEMGCDSDHGFENENS